MRRFLAFLFCLLTATPAIAASAGNAIGHANVQAQAALANGGYGMCCVRMRYPSSLSTAVTGSNNYVVVRIHTVAPPWASSASDYMPHISNYFLSGNSPSTGSEQPATSPLTVVWQTFCLDAPACSGGAWPVTFNNALGVVVGINEGIYGHVQKNASAVAFHPSAGQDIWVTTEFMVPVGQKMPVGYLANLQGDNMTEGGSGFSSDQSALRLGGSFVIGLGNSIRPGPDYILVNGWSSAYQADGIIGTSRAYAQNEYDYKLAAKGATGAIERGLTSDTGGAHSTGNFSAEGAYVATTINNGVHLRLTGLLGAPNWPISALHTDDNVNDINTGGSGIPISLAGIQILDKRFWNYWHGICKCNITHYYGEPWAPTTTSFSFWSNVAGQIPKATAAQPNGLQWQVNNWLDSGVGVPSFVTRFNYGADFQDPVQTDHWQAPSPSITGIVTADCATNVRSCSFSLTGIPNEGDAIVLDVGNSNAENQFTNQVVCTGPSGSPPMYACTLAFGGTNSNVHLANAQAATAFNHDGIHQLTTLSKAAGSDIAGNKPQ